MTRRPRIELPSERDDELPARSLIATSLGCALLGLSVAYAITARDAGGLASQSAPAALGPEPGLEFERDAGVAAGERQDAAAEDTLVSARAVEPPDAAIESPGASATTVLDATLTPAERRPSSEADDVQADPAAAPQPEPVAQPEPEPQPARKLRVEAGTFAYLRCEGLPKRKGPYPCPRDRALEQQLRAVIEPLPSCRVAGAISRGIYDVRLELGPSGTVSDLHVRAPNEASDKAVRACAAAAFRKVETRLQPARMIVSMRFRAR